MQDFGNNQKKLSFDFIVKSPNAEYFIYPEPTEIPPLFEPLTKLFEPEESFHAMFDKMQIPPIPDFTLSSEQGFRKPTKQDLLEVAKRGYLVRKNSGVICNNYPYPESSVVICDNCDKSKLNVFIHYAKLDLCLPCTENIVENYSMFKQGSECQFPFKLINCDTPTDSNF